MDEDARTQARPRIGARVTVSLALGTLAWLITLFVYSPAVTIIATFGLLVGVVAVIDARSRPTRRAPLIVSFVLNASALVITLLALNL